MAMKAKTTEAVKTNQDEPVKRKRGAGRLVLICILLFGAGVFFLPRIVEQLFQTKEGFAWLTGGGMNADVAVGKASVGWQTPMLLTAISVKSPDGLPLAEVDAVTSQRSLWDILTRAKNAERYDLDGLKISLVIPDPDEQSSVEWNVAELLDQVQSFEVAHPDKPTIVNIRNARIEFLNAQRQPVDVWENVSGSYQYDPENGGKQTVSLLTPNAAQPDVPLLAVNAVWTAGAGEAQPEAMNLDVKSNALSLVGVDPWLRKHLGANHPLQSCTGVISAGFQRRDRQGWNLVSNCNLHGSGTAQGAPLQSLPSAVQAMLEADFNIPEDRLTLPRLTVNAQGLTADLQGRIEKVTGEKIVDLQGNLHAPGLSLADLLPEPLRSELRIEGMSISNIRMHGPLAPIEGGQAPPLEFSMLASWQSASGYGLHSQAGSVRLALKDQIVRAEPVQLSMNGGRVLALPILDLRSEPAILHFPDAMILENIQLTEEVCRDWIKYVSPALANATSAQGRFSLSTRGGSLPVGDMARGKLEGTLSIPEAQVRPGPLAQETLGMVAQLRAFLRRPNPNSLAERPFMTISQETVPFQLHEGRVYHQNFGLYVGDVRVATAGSVGLDDTLQLQLTMGMPDQWFENAGPVLAALRGESVQMSVTGTLDRPQVDASPLAEFGKRAGIKAGTGLLNNILDRALRRD